jgi:hypothetical protein
MEGKNMGESVLAVLRSKAAKVFYAIVMVVAMFLLGSWTTNQTLKQNFDGYKNYTISQIISNELDKKDGVNQRLTEIKSVVVGIQDTQNEKNDADYQDWVADIDKYYGWSDGNHDALLSSGYLSKMSIHWNVLPEKYKTDIVKMHYNYAFDYIGKHCK